MYVLLLCPAVEHHEKHKKKAMGQNSERTLGASASFMVECTWIMHIASSCTQPAVIAGRNLLTPAVAALTEIERNT